MSLVKFFGELNHRNRLLYLWGLFYCFLFAIALLLSIFDHRQLMGLNIWIKPSKFAISFAIFLFTMAWLGYYLPNQKKVRRFSRTAVVVFIIETLAIFGQAARGVKSHFNYSTFGDALIFQLMGAAITVNSLYVLYLAYQFFKQRTILPKPYLWGIRLGMLFFVIFSFEGFIMAQRLAHTVGAADGSKGLFYLNWSKLYGDLRVAHLIGIHSLQILPIIGWLISEGKNKLLTRYGTILTICISFLYFLLSAGLFMQAWHGHSLFSFQF